MILFSPTPLVQLEKQGQEKRYGTDKAMQQVSGRAIKIKE